MIVRVRRAAAALAVAAALLTGCTGTPAPTPSASAPLTDEQAFAAAEETYRAYVDALNQVDLSDPATFEPVFALTTGEANANERESLSRMHAEGWRITGTTILEGFEGESVAHRTDGSSVTALACTDVSQVLVVNSQGNSVVDPARPEKFVLRVVFIGAAGELAIASSNAVGNATCD